MNASVLTFRRCHRDTIEIAAVADGGCWRVAHVRAPGVRLPLGDFLTIEEAKDFAYRAAFNLGRTRVLVLGEGGAS